MPNARSGRVPVECANVFGWTAPECRGGAIGWAAPPVGACVAGWSGEASGASRHLHPCRVVLGSDRRTGPRLGNRLTGDQRDGSGLRSGEGGGDAVSKPRFGASQDASDPAFDDVHRSFGWRKRAFEGPSMRFRNRVPTDPRPLRANEPGTATRSGHCRPPRSAPPRAAPCRPRPRGSRRCRPAQPPAGFRPRRS